MRKLSVIATLMLFGAGAASKASAAIALKGSDTLEDVTKQVIAQCTFADAANKPTYSGGGSGGGESAMIAATQQIAPMSRELSGSTLAGTSVACDSTKGAQELLIGLDGIALVTANSPHGDSLERTASLADDCGDAITGGAKIACDTTDPVVAPTHGCVLDTDGVTWVYIFKDWKDVLAMVYGGQNHGASSGAAALLIDNAAEDVRFNPTEASLTAHRKLRNPVRISCGGPMRVSLVNSWGNLFHDVGGASPLKCRDACCTRLKHAFRRGDLSGTTDTFVGLVGLIAIPAQTTKTTSTFFPAIDAKATANPFCNAGEAPMNKGDSDYLDLDPIRRFADATRAPRTGLEQVSEGFLASANPTTACPDERETYVQPLPVLQDFAWSNFQMMGGDNVAVPIAQLPAPTAWVAAQEPAMKARKGLGVVLPIEIPTNYGDDQIAYWSPSAAPGQAPVVCDTTPAYPKLIGANVVCPYATAVNSCLLPGHKNPDGTINYNCMSNLTTPGAGLIPDARANNLLVVNAAGTFQKDNYNNPNVAIAAARQPRLVNAFFRLHTTQVTAVGGTPTIAANPTGVCKNTTSTDQIGCLVRANPCSIGFAGREAVDAANLSMAFRIGNDIASALPASTPRIENLVNGSGSPAYAIARKLWVNAYKGLAAVTNGTTPNAGEQELLGCFGFGGNTTIVDNAISTFNFVPVPSTLPDGTPITVNRTVTCTLPTCAAGTVTGTACTSGSAACTIGAQTCLCTSGARVCTP